MKNRIAALLISLAIIIGVMPATVLAETSSLEDKAVYYTAASDYKSGDCILTATKMMIRRGMIMNNTGDWSKITNKVLRGPATIFGLLLNSFRFDAEGLVFGIDSGKFSGKGNAARIKEFEDLLNAHPEGIVVHGTNAASSGTHGVLVVKVENGVVYAADSSRNTGLNNIGIQEWKNTTMLDPCKVTKYWYISQISRSTQTVPSSIQPSSEESTLNISSVRAPKKIKQGKTFSIKGVIRSNKNITKVRVRILNSKGKKVISSSRKPDAKAFNLKEVDARIKFGTLKKGAYTYQVIASDTSQTITLVNKQFKVVKK
ncbi:MAG: hypothetical protein IKF42_02250 [Mogibacterium sp.]|nr:hypothetical protein [Mogibacterium sp.]